MNRLWQQLAIATNWPVLVAIVVLSSVGILSLWADSPAEGQKQLIFLAVAIGSMAVFQMINYLKIGRFAWPFYIFSALLILYTVLGAMIGGDSPLPLVKRVNGAYHWLNFKVMSLQPSELMKIAFIMVLARYLRFRSNYRTFSGLLRPFALAMLPILLIFRQPDLGTALVFLPVLFVMLFVAGAKIKHLLAIVALGLAMSPFLWFCGEHKLADPDGHLTGEICPSCPHLPILRHLPQFIKHYQRDRVAAMFSRDPALLRSIGFQSEKAMIALGSGGATGKGFGQVPVGQSVPEAHNDMIFALIGEQFGFVGSAVVLFAYLVLFAAGIEISAATREPFGRLVAVGLVAQLAGQTFINLMVVMRLMPVTGVTLPFVSAGGSSLLASYMAAGLLLNIGQNRPLVMARDSFEFD